MKKALLILFLMPTLLVSCGTEEGYKSESEYLYVVSMSLEVKNRCKDPESYSVYGTCKYGVNDQGTKFVVIPFRAKNGFGAYRSDTAYFSKDTFRGTYNGYTSSNCSYDLVTKTIISSMIDYTGWDKTYTAEQVNSGM